MATRLNRRTIRRCIAGPVGVESLESRTLLSGTPHLRFFSQPAASIVNSPVAPPVTVAILDDTNSIISADTSTVTLAIASSDSGGSISGVTTAAAVNGIATFSDVVFATPGFYTLTATDGADTPDTSTQFTVIAAVANVALTSSNLQPIVGDSVTISANVTGTQGVPTGTVTFFNGSTVLGMADLTQGIASLTTQFPLGSSTITATYNGDSLYGPSNSVAAVTESVTASSILQTTLVGGLPTTVIAGQKTNIRQQIALTNLGKPLIGQFKGTVFLAPNTVIDASSIELPQALLKNLKLGTKKHAGLTLKLKSVPATTPAGTYHLLVQLTDPTGATNLAASAGTLNVIAPVIDLSGAIKKAPNSTKLGKPFSISIILSNAGNVPATGMLPITLSAALANQNGQAATTIAVPPRRINVKPGKPATLTLNHVISLSAAGSYTLLVQLDPTNTLGDSNTANNQFSSLPILVG